MPNDTFESLLGEVPKYDPCPHYEEDPSAPFMQTEADGEWMRVEEIREALAGVKIQQP